MKKKFTRLETYLMRQMSAYDWNYPIGSELGWSKMRLGKYVAYPHNIPFEKAIELADYLENISNWKFGRKTRLAILVNVYSVSKNKLNYGDYEKYIK